MKLKYCYIVLFRQDRGADEYEFFTKEGLKNINSYAECVRIYKIEKELSLEEKKKLGLDSIDDR